MTKNFYDIQLDAIRQMLFAAGFTETAPDEFKTPRIWRDHFVGDESTIHHVLNQTWRIKDAVSLYVEYLLKMSAAMEVTVENIHK